MGNKRKRCAIEKADRFTTILAVVIVVLFLGSCVLKSIDVSGFEKLKETIKEIKEFTDTSDTEKVEIIRDKIRTRYGIEVIFEPDENIMSESAKSAVLMDLLEILSESNPETSAKIERIHLCEKGKAEEISNGNESEKDVYIEINVELRSEYE